MNIRYNVFTWKLPSLYSTVSIMKKGSDRMKLIQTGIEDFKTLIDKNVYYVDKTNFISEVLYEKVVIYTRPRRFGKTLNMSMLYYFFSNKEKENAYLFDGLNISHNEEAMRHQNQYPVIFLSLKEMGKIKFESQIEKYRETVSFCAKDNLELPNVAVKPLALAMGI